MGYNESLSELLIRGDIEDNSKIIMPPPPHTKGEGIHIGFSADPGSLPLRDSLNPLYFLINGLNFTILAWIHHWDKPKG